MNGTIATALLNAISRSKRAIASAEKSNEKRKSILFLRRIIGREGSD